MLLLLLSLKSVELLRLIPLKTTVTVIFSQNCFLLDQKGHVEEQAEEDFLSQEFLLHEDPRSKEGTNTEQIPHNDGTSKFTDNGCMSRKEQTETDSVRQRRNRQSREVIYVYAVLNVPHEEV